MPKQDTWGPVYPVFFSSSCVWSHCGGNTGVLKNWSYAAASADHPLCAMTRPIFNGGSGFILLSRRLFIQLKNEDILGCF